MYLEVLLLLLLIWYYVSYLRWKKSEKYQLMEKLPGATRYPILGTEYVFIGVQRKDLFEAYLGQMKKYGRVHRSWHGSIPQVHLAKPEHLEIVMNNSIQINKGDQYDSFLPWLGEGLLLSAGSKWHRRRKLLTPTFHFKILENFLPVFIEKSDTLVDILSDKTNGEAFDIYPFITHCALDIICETAMGVSVNAMIESDNKYIKSVYEVCELMLIRMLQPWYKSDVYYLTPNGRKFKRCLSVLHGFSRQVIRDRKQALINGINKQMKEENSSLGKKQRLSFLDLLLQQDVSLNDEEIREEVDTFMFEGHDTTTAGICWSLFLLGNYPDVQEKLYNEIDHVLQGRGSIEKLSELGDMKYLECVIKEALRIYPSVPFITRSLSEDINIDQYKIPAGTDAVLYICEAHRDERYFPDPERFDPDRFLPENSQNRHPYAFVPFSAGPRNCIGQKFAMFEEKTVIASIISKYKVRAIHTQENIRPLCEIITRPYQGIHVVLEKRHK